VSEVGIGKRYEALMRASRPSSRSYVTKREVQLMRGKVKRLGHKVSAGERSNKDPAEKDMDATTSHQS
jgi:hypothetical protein